MFRLSLFTFFVYSSFTVISLFLPLYFQYKGFSIGEIGVVMGLGYILTVFSQPFWGLVSDRYKTIKKVLALLLIAGTMISIPMFASGTFYFVIFFVMMFMFFFPSTGPLTESLMVKYSNENNRNYGSIRLWGEVGFGITALWLGFTLEKMGMGILGWLFIGMIAISLVSLIWLPDAKPHAPPVTKEKLVQLFSYKPFLLFVGLQLLIAIPHRMNDTFLPIYIKELGGLESYVGLAMLIATFSAVPTMALMGFLLSRFSELILISIAAFFYIIRWGLYGVVNDPIYILVFQVMHLLTFPIVLVASVQFVYKIVPRELTSTGQTIYLSVYFGIGGIIGSFTGGWIMSNLPSHVLYFAGASLCLLGFIMLLIFLPYFTKLKKNTINYQRRE